MEEQTQLRLFPTTVREVLSTISLSPTRAEFLFAEGLLSFHPELDRTLLPAEQAELIFIGALARLPLSREAIRIILKSLEPPYAYSHERIYYDWSSGGWRGFSEKKSTDQEKVLRAGKVEWAEVAALAQKIFSVGPGPAGQKWAEAAWDMVLRGGLADYANGFERGEACIRFLALGEIYLDFCRQAWQAEKDFHYLAWGKEIGLDLLQIIMMIGPEERLDPVDQEEELFSLGLKYLMDESRGELISLLKKESGGSKPLFLSLWKLNHPDQVRSVPEIFRGLTPSEHKALSWLEQGRRME